MNLKSGMRIRSSVCTTEALVVKTTAADVDLHCGGAPMQPEGLPVESGELDPDFASGSTVGKRYVDPGGGLVVLCVKGGKGSMSIGTTALEMQAPRSLPASD